MLGFAELERGLWIRPNNLDGGVAALRSRLHALGLGDEAPVFVIKDLAPAQEKHAHSLWNGKTLTASYARTERQIERWMDTSADLELDVAARQSFLLGGSAIRQIVYDPLLPGELVDVEARHSFFEAVRRIDADGRRIWKQFFETLDDRSALRTEALTTAAN
jgi:phenylacetic acid degradation operon negative regulatory protein